VLPLQPTAAATPSHATPHAMLVEGLMRE